MELEFSGGMIFKISLKLIQILITHVTARVVKLKLWWLILLIVEYNIVSVEYIDILMVK